jgi:ABC-type branched-subunit amino acid transport system permease subunit
MDIRSSLREGLLSGIVNVFIILLGLTSLVGTMIEGWFGLPSPMLGAWLVLLGIALWGGARAGGRALEKSEKQAPLAGIIAGAVHGLLVAILVWSAATVTNTGFELRKWLAQLTVEAIEMLTFGLDPTPAALLDLVLLIVASLLGSLLVLASARYGWRESLSLRSRTTTDRVRNLPAVQRFRQHKYSQQITFGIVVAILLILPFLIGRYWNYTLGTVGIYVMLGLGLNIVVGFAGLLDLGYVAFFAIGGYTVALLTAPTPHGIMMDFWLALPIGIALAALSGILLGIPVLRMRGDYLAIVTLGFGEIIRILSKSDALTSFSGGPRGVRAVAGPSIFGVDLSSPIAFLFLIMLGIVLVAFVTNRLQHSRVGRAWMAMREDEDVAEAMGIHTLKYKLLAFAIGAAFAGMGGAIFASRNRFTGPEDFTLMVSINVLCLVIIGGMGSIPGVIVGALVLKGLPEVLRELEDYRMLVFGALLIFMMIVRPEGLWPSKRRRMELRDIEDVPIEYHEATG